MPKSPSTHSARGSTHVKLSTTKPSFNYIPPSIHSPSDIRFGQLTPQQSLNRVWELTDQFFADVPSLYHIPISLRNPYIFYMGHIPAFAYNKLQEHHRLDTLNAYFQALFARGKDPDVDDPSLCHSHPDAPDQWPGEEEVARFVNDVHRVISSLVLKDAVHRGLFEHDAMHLETLYYMRAQDNKKPLRIEYCAGANQMQLDSWQHIEAGALTLGDRIGETWDDFKWDNEGDCKTVSVSPFLIRQYAVTNMEFLNFVKCGGYCNRDFWADDWEWVVKERLSMPATWRKVGDVYFTTTNVGFHKHVDNNTASWPVCVSLAEALAFSRWKNARIATEAEWLHAAGKRAETWTNVESCGQRSVTVGDENENGLVGMVGNGWEWTMSEFDRFDGFEETPFYREYSADFFDGKHFVLKGASWVTMSENVRWSFRNFYQKRYRYMFAKFRLVRDC